MTLRDYAKHREERGLVGKSVQAVSKAIKGGRLVKSVVRDHRGEPKIADPELADREWAAGTDYSKAPGKVKVAAEPPRRTTSPPPELGPGDPLAPGPIAPPLPSGAPSVSAMDGEVEEPTDLSLTRESAREKFWKAHQAELEFRKRAKELVEAKEVRGKLVEVFGSCRTKLLGVPSRARAADPTLTTPQLAIFEALVREALEDLAAAAAPSSDEAEPAKAAR